MIIFCLLQKYKFAFSTNYLKIDAIKIKIFEIIALNDYLL